MKPNPVLAAVAALLATAGCDSQNAGGSGAPAGEPVAAVPPPEGGDWAKVVTQTPAGGFMMGNPEAPVKLVEYASMTCPHCAEFSSTGSEPLVDKYVKQGRVSFEVRNYVRDPLDIAMSLIARCGGAERFFPLTDAMFKSQSEFFERLQTLSPEQQQALTQLPPAQQFAGYAQHAGLQQWAAMRGVPSARQQQCLSDEAEINRLVQMTSDATTEHPDFKGTPSFVINGELVEGSTWQLLEPKLREALGD